MTNTIQYNTDYTVGRFSNDCDFSREVKSFKLFMRTNVLCRRCLLVQFSICESQKFSYRYVLFMFIRVTVSFQCTDVLPWRSEELVSPHLKLFVCLESNVLQFVVGQNTWRHSATSETITPHPTVAWRRLCRHTSSIHVFVVSTTVWWVYSGAPKKTTDKLQRVLNAAARVV